MKLTYYLLIILFKVIVSLFCIKKLLLSTLLRTLATAKCACIRNTNVCFFQCMHASQVGQHFNLRPNFEFWKRRHYPIIPTGMRSNIKGRWQLGHQCESFHWSIIYTVVTIWCYRWLKVSNPIIDSVIISSSVGSWTQVVDLCVQSIVRNNFQSQNKIRIN